MGTIRVTQNVGTTNKVCYPFMKGKSTPITFCPVWRKESSTSFLPAGLNVIFKHNAQNASRSWDTLQFYRTSSNPNTVDVPTNIIGAGKFVSPYHFNVASTTYTANLAKFDWNHVFTLDDGVMVKGQSAGKYTFNVNKGCIIYPAADTINNRIFGIVPFTNYKNATAVFGCIAAIPTASTNGYISACWYASHLDNTMRRASSTTVIPWSAWSAGNFAWTAFDDARHIANFRYSNPASYTAAWPANANTIFTGMKFLGQRNTNNLVFWQFSSTFDANNIMTPPTYSISANGMNFTSAIIYDSWIGLKF